MATRPPRATATTAASSRTGRNSSRPALRRVAAASIGHMTSPPATTNSVSAVAIPARAPSGAPAPTATPAPAPAPTTAAQARRGTAESNG